MSPSPLTRLIALALLALAMPLRLQAAPVDMSADQFRMYKQYQAALADPRVQRMSESRRLPAIARNFRVPERTLREVVTRGDALGPSVGRACETEIRQELTASSVTGRVGDVRVDATDGHVVTYVEWRNDDADKLEEEAATVAMVAAHGAPISSTIALWAKDPSGRKVFEAKISADAAANFRQDRIAMFARARYIRVFEDVHNAYNGTPPTD